MGTFAGGGTPDADPPLSEHLGSISGIAVDREHNVYAVLSNPPLVLRFDPGGQVTRVAGTGIVGFSGDGGPATNAELSDYDSLAVAEDGTLYIADCWNGRIRKIANGIITTVAGGGFVTGDGGQATSATLFTPVGIAVDSHGDLYFAEEDNSRVRKVSGGVITTIAGTGTAGFGGDGGPAAEAQLSFSTSVAVDGAGNVYIADTGNARIREISGGVITTIAGGGDGGDNGPATQARMGFDATTTIALDPEGNLYLTIRRISNGIITTVAGGGGSRSTPVRAGPALGFPLADPGAVACDSDGSFYIADLGSGLGQVLLRASNGYITTVAGGGTGTGDGGSALLGQLDSPSGMALDPFGSLFIADSGDNRVRVVKNDIITTFAGNGLEGLDQGDGGPATDAVIWGPNAVALDGSGNIYILEGSTIPVHIRKVSNGVISTVAGTGGKCAPVISGDESISYFAVSGNGDILVAFP